MSSDNDNDDDDNSDDDIVCDLEFASWLYDGFQMDLQIQSEHVDLSNYVMNRGWEMVEASVRRDVTYYACCPEPFPKVTATIRLRKKPASGKK